MAPQKQTESENIHSDKRSETRESRQQSDPSKNLFHPHPKPFFLSTSPHIVKQVSVPIIMWSVILALTPATVIAVFYFGFAAFRLILACLVSAVLTELLINFTRKQSITITDGSAAITGLLLALTLPPTLPVGNAVVGSVFAIAIGKHVFGGLGSNIFNPALLGRAFMQAGFPVSMTSWVLPFQIFDGVSAATPLGLFKFEKTSTPIMSLLTGNIGGCLGETSGMAILGGGLFLLLFKFADWRIPVAFLGTVFIVTTVFWLADSVSYANPAFHLLSGGLMLGAFFMATDMVTSPVTPVGSWLFGVGAGLLVVVIRFFGGLPEGVMYSVLIMNALTPLINRYTKPKYFGESF